MASSPETQRASSQPSSRSLSRLPELSLSLKEKKQKKPQQPRQLLSCTKCRERKVKCDRTKPCSACCARGLPKECHFVLGEGSEFGPIQQSLELRKLRVENQRLKERLLAGRGNYSSDSEDEEGSSTGKSGPQGRRPSRQRRFQTLVPTDNLYFGSPSLASVIADFANLQSEPKSLSHATPRGADMYAAHDTIYPFPTLWPFLSRTQGLLQCLPPREQLFKHLDSFTQRSLGFVFPYAPEELSTRKVELFLENIEENAENVPDMLALIFAALALGVQLDSFEGNDHSSKAEGASQAQGGEIFSVAAMQALRLSSFTSRPTLNAIQALIILAPYLTNSGRFLDAWSMFGLTIRLAHSIGLHRNPRYLDNVPQLRERTTRSTLWWWMLHMDQQYSMTLGRPLGISGIGDCPPADPLTTDPAALRLGDFFDQITILGRQILSSNQLTDARIDTLTNKLFALWDTMPDSLRFSRSWIHTDTELPEWPLEMRATMYYCKIHNYIILLNRQRIENGQDTPDQPPSPRSLQNTAGTEYLLPPAHSYASPSPSIPVPRGRPLVLHSCSVLLDAFVFFYKRVPTALIDWSIGQEQFNACMILLLDAFETKDLSNVGRVEHAYAIFVEMDKRGMHQLTGLAVSRISEALLQLRNFIEHDAVPASMTAPYFPAANVKQDERGTPSRPHFEWEMDTETRASSFHHEGVMASTGMWLLEDYGLQGNAARPIPPTYTACVPSNADVSSQGNAESKQSMSHPVSVLARFHTPHSEPRRDSAAPLHRLPSDPIMVQGPPMVQSFRNMTQQATNTEGWQVRRQQHLVHSQTQHRGSLPSQQGRQ